MIQASKEVLEAIINLDNNEDFKKFADWIRSSEISDMQSITLAVDEVRMRWFQGKLQNMNDILTTIEKAFYSLQAYKDYMPEGKNPDI